MKTRIAVPDLIAEGHCRRITSGKICHPGRFAFEVAQALRLSISEIHHAITAGAPTIINDLVLRQTPAFVITIICDLVIELAGRRMKLEHPVQTPARFVQHVCDTVSPGLSQPIEVVTKNLLRPGLKTISKEHLGRSIARCQQVLQKITGIVPTTASVEVSS